MSILRNYGSWGRPVDAIEGWWGQVEKLALESALPTENARLIEAQTRLDFATYLYSYVATSFYKAYESASPRWREYAAVKELPDFNEHRIKGKNRLSGVGYIGEHGHYPGARRTFRPEASIMLDTYGVIQEITRQALLTQGVRELVADEPQEMAQAFEDFLARAVIALMVANPVAPDGDRMASIARGNLTTAPLSEASFIDACTWFDEQEDADGNPINNDARHLILKSTRLATVANRIIRSQLTGASAPGADGTGTSSTTPDKGTRNAIIDTVNIPGDFVLKEKFWPVATDWTLVADPSKIPAFMVGLLQGQQRPTLLRENPSMQVIGGGGGAPDPYQVAVDKLATKGRWDLGLSAVDPLGWYAGRPA